MKNRVTLNDIAKIVGVSKMTVSLAMRGDSSVSDEMMRRVKEIANQLGYTPNRFAQGLVNGKSHTIALLLGGSLHDDYQNQIIRGAMPYAFEKGYTLTVAPVECDQKVELSYIQKYQNMMVDGFLAFHCMSAAPYKMLKKNGTPFVLYTKYFENLDCDYVVCNDFNGGYQITRHLLELGHRKIAFVYDEYLKNSSEVVNRKKGYLAALEEFGISAGEARMIPFEFNYLSYKEKRNETSEMNEKFIRAMLDENRPTALFVCNDVLASNLYIELKQNGLCIPEDISVAGYEGVYLGKILEPPLTTVKSPIEEIGRKACKLLIDIIEGKTSKTEIIQIKLEPELEIRGSTARLA